MTPLKIITTTSALLFLLLSATSLTSQAHLDVEGSAKVKEILTIANSAIPKLRLDRTIVGQNDVELSNEDGSLVIRGGGSGTGTDLLPLITMRPIISSATPTAQGLLTLGFLDNQNLVMDLNQIMARNNGSVVDLYFQNKAIRMRGNGEIWGSGLVALDDNDQALSFYSNEVSQATAVATSGINSHKMWIAVSDAAGNNFQSIYFENTAGFGGGLPNGTFYPASNDVIDLGGLSNKWRNVYSANGTIQTSDARLKKDIVVLDYGLDAIRMMNPVSYRWKDMSMGSDKKIGFIAQEMELIVPESVIHNKLQADPEADTVTDPYAMNYSELIPVLTRGIQELAEENDLLKTRLAALEKTVSDLKSQ